MADPWDNDPIIKPAPAPVQDTGNPWDNDPIIKPSAQTPQTLDGLLDQHFGPAKTPQTLDDILDQHFPPTQDDTQPKKTPEQAMQDRLDLAQWHVGQAVRRGITDPAVLSQISRNITAGEDPDDQNNVQPTELPPGPPGDERDQHPQRPPDIHDAIAAHALQTYKPGDPEPLDTYDISRLKDRFQTKFDMIDKAARDAAADAPMDTPTQAKARELAHYNPNFDPTKGVPEEEQRDWNENDPRRNGQFATDEEAAHRQTSWADALRDIKSTVPADVIDEGSDRDLFNRAMTFYAQQRGNYLNAQRTNQSAGLGDFRDMPGGSNSLMRDVYSGLASTGGKMASLVAAGGALLDNDPDVKKADEALSKQAYQKSNAISSGAAQVDPGTVHGIVRSTVGMLAQAAMAGPAAHGAPMLFAATGYNDALKAADDAGVKGFAKYGYASGTALLQGLSGEFTEMAANAAPSLFNAGTQTLTNQGARALITNIVTKGGADSLGFMGVAAAQKWMDKVVGADPDKQWSLDDLKELALSSIGQAMLLRTFGEGRQAMADFKDNASRTSLKDAGINFIFPKTERAKLADSIPTQESIQAEFAQRGAGNAAPMDAQGTSWPEPQLAKPTADMSRDELNAEAQERGIKSPGLKSTDALAEQIAQARQEDTTTPERPFSKPTENMTPEEMQAEIAQLRQERHTDRLTGLKNATAYEEADKKAVQTFMDVDGLKSTNDRFGHEAGNQLLKAIADAVKRSQLSTDVYRTAGDEHALQHDTESDAKADQNKLQQFLNGAYFRVVDKDGTVYEAPLRMSYGFGKTIEDAEAAAGEMKRAREQSGQRELRSDWEQRFKADPTALPRGFDRVSSGGLSVPGDLSQTERSVARTEPSDASRPDQSERGPATTADNGSARTGTEGQGLPSEQSQSVQPGVGNPAEATNGARDQTTQGSPAETAESLADLTPAEIRRRMAEEFNLKSSGSKSKDIERYLRAQDEARGTGGVSEVSERTKPAKGDDVLFKPSNLRKEVLGKVAAENSDGSYTVRHNGEQFVVKPNALRRPMGQVTSERQAAEMAQLSPEERRAVTTRSADVRMVVNKLHDEILGRVEDEAAGRGGYNRKLQTNIAARDLRDTYLSKRFGINDTSERGQAEALPFVLQEALSKGMEPTGELRELKSVRLIGGVEPGDTITLGGKTWRAKERTGEGIMLTDADGREVVFPEGQVPIDSGTQRQRGKVLTESQRAQIGGGAPFEAPEPESKPGVVVETDLLGQQKARLAEPVTRTEQQTMFDNSVTPELARERKIAQAHRESGGKELFDEQNLAEKVNPFLKAKREEGMPEPGAAGMMLPTPITGKDVSFVAQKVGAMADIIHRVFAPASVSAESKTTAGVVRERTAELAQKTERAAEALKDFSKAMSRTPVAERLKFIDAMERGGKQPTPELQQGADVLRKLLDDTRTEVQNLGTGKLQNFIDNYFPHIWKDTATAKNVFEQLAGKRPLEGPKSFLKKRTIPTLADGIAAGLEPVTTNPVDLALLKVREMNRYIMAQKIVQEMQSKGLTQFVRATDKPPAGYTRLDDRVFTEYAPPNSKGGISIRGYQYAPESAARVLNNYLSPGLHGNAIYDSFRWLGNVMNQAQLGLSAFHLGFTSADSVTSKVALGVRQFVEGHPLEALGNLARAPIAPIENYLRGSKVLSEYMRPGTSGGDIAKIVDGVVAGGGRVKMDDFYKNSSAAQFWKALDEGRTGGAIMQAVPALLEQASRPIMENLVPRMKLGVMADIARYELSKLPANATREQIREVMGKAWDSVDNRMGQLVYDNLFWNKTLKDAAMASVRSVGWNLGTLRELGGGAADLAKMSKDIATRQKPEFTNRAAYLVALPFTTAVMGGVMHYMMTGRRPDDTKDLFFPQTGRLNQDGTPERVQLPTYMKDVLSYTRHPVDTLKAKLHPIFGTIADMLSNKDYYGNEIRNPNDPLVQQMKQSAEYIGKSFVPFSIRNAQEAAKRDQPASRQALSFFGVTPAKREDTRTPAQNLMAGFNAARAGSTTKTPEEAQAADTKRELLNQARSGDAKETIKGALDAGQISGKDAKNLLKKATGNPMVDSFKALPIDQARQVYAAANDDEKATLHVPMQRKEFNNELENLKGKKDMGSLQPDERARLHQLEAAHQQISRIERATRSGLRKDVAEQRIGRILDNVSDSNRRSVRTVDLAP